MNKPTGMSTLSRFGTPEAKIPSTAQFLRVRSNTATSIGIDDRKLLVEGGIRP